MPIYEYECKSCNKIFEELQSFGDEDLKKCPYCNKKKVKKLISLSSFQLKGDGWYSTDYARKPKITHTSTPSEGQDATKQSIESVTGQNAETTKKSVADSISKDVKKANVVNVDPRFLNENKPTQLVDEINNIKNINPSNGFIPRLTSFAAF